MSPERKSAQWITIPEENSSKKSVSPASNIDVVKNKWLWGVGFALVLMMSFVFLVPNQFNELFQGNLFDAQGISEEDMKINLVPTKKDQKNTEVSNENESMQVAVSPQASAEPVSIAISPIQPKVCENDLPCFESALTDCSLATASATYSLSGQSIKALLSIDSSGSDYCDVSVQLKEGPLELIGSIANCKIQKTFSAGGVVSSLSNADQFNQACTGDLAAKMTGYLAKKEVEDEQNAKQKLIEDLNKKIENLNQKLADQSSGLRSAASDLGANSNVALGQQGVQNPAFKVNPYRVQVTPEEILRSRQLNTSSAYSADLSSGGSVVSARQINGQLANDVSQNQLRVVQQTPETGPTETLLLALIITYIGFFGLKYFKSLSHR